MSAKKIIVAGVVAGTLDAIAAVVVYKADPIRMFQFIASGAVGKDAFGSDLYAVLGAIFHFIIATIWAALFYLFAPALRSVLKHWLIMGVVWGIVIWLSMNLVVLPLSKIGGGAFDWEKALIGMAIIIVAVGIPVSFLLSKRRS